MKYFTVVMIIMPFVLSAHISEVENNETCKIDAINMMAFVESLDYKSERYKKVESILNEIDSTINSKRYCLAVDKLTKALK